LLELYHFGPVANSLTPLLCLLEKGMPFQNSLLNSRLWEHHSPEFQQLSPDGLVPILVHDGRVVRESRVINEYVDMVCPEVPLRPADP
jgi:glutathione S-transferase